MLDIQITADFDSRNIEPEWLSAELNELSKKFDLITSFEPHETDVETEDNSGIYEYCLLSDVKHTKEPALVYYQWGDFVRKATRKYSAYGLTFDCTIDESLELDRCFNALTFQCMT